MLHVFDIGGVLFQWQPLSIAVRTGLAVDDVLRVIDGVPRELQPTPETVDLLARLRDAGAAQAEPRLCERVRWPAGGSIRAARPSRPRDGLSDGAQ